VKFFKENHIIEDCLGISIGYDIMKTFINNMKIELSNISILPSLTTEKLNKFKSQRIILDAKTWRNLYEKWSDAKITDIINKSQMEYL